MLLWTALVTRYVDVNLQGLSHTKNFVGEKRLQDVNNLRMLLMVIHQVYPPLPPHLQISTSLQILSELTVDWPPPSPPSPPTNFNLCRSYLSWLSIDPPPLPPHLQISTSADPFWVDCQSTPSPHLQISTSEFAVDQPSSMLIWADQQILSKILHIPTKQHVLLHREHSHRGKSNKPLQSDSFPGYLSSQSTDDSN